MPVIFYRSYRPALVQWERGYAMQGCKYQESGILGAILEEGYPTLFGKERSLEEGHALKRLMV